MPLTLPTLDFLNAPGLILDVRSPAEYDQGHIPGAVSFPLFSNEERAQVGICYKQQGRDQAVELGFAIAGPKFASFITQAKSLVPDRQVRLHCWRGGMRSEAVAWVLEMAGFKVVLLIGGYKAFRRWGHTMLQGDRPLIVLGGMTGTGKTAILSALAAMGEQVLDLEALASHRGSSYGSLGLPAQPTNEQFENLIMIHWAAFKPHQPVWIEAESRRIGICRIPDLLFGQMERSPVLEITRSRPERLEILVQIYGSIPLEDLVVATERIRKHLGGLRTQQAVNLLRQGKTAEAFDIVLGYYDSTYTYDLKRRQRPVHPVDVSELSPLESAKLVLTWQDKILYSMPPL